jgi:hypothetical protein
MSSDSTVSNHQRLRLHLRLNLAPDGTYLFLAPVTSLPSMDDAIAPLPVYAEGLAAARAKDAPKIAADSEISREHLLFRINPRISYVSDAFAESDQEFWRGKK